MEKNFRLKLLLVTICAGLLAGIAFSRELWFPVGRTFPRAALLFALPDGFVTPFEWLFGSILVASLISIIFSYRPQIFLVSAIFSILLLSFFDQLHFQPWVYQYSLIFAVFCRRDRNDKNSNQTLGLAQIVIAGLYFWGGLQKLSYSFSHEILPVLLAPLQNLFPTVRLPYVFLGIIIPLTETMIGIGLLARRTRNAAVCSAIGMHLVILILLIARNYNSVVWIWSLTLIFAVIFAFWKTENSFKDTIFAGKFTPPKLLICACFLLPFLNFFGYWDSFLSGNYYSGSVEIPVIRIDDEIFEKLSPTARASVFQTKTTGEKMLPLFEWSINDTNAPVYLEERVFRQIAREICQLTHDKNETELIIRERPAILDGKAEVLRISCSQLENGE